MMSVSDGVMQRFFAKVSIPNAMGCMIWNGARNPKGYDSFYDGTCYPSGHKRMVVAHRFSYQFYVGHIPDGLCVCHHCDNPSCVNPEHLFLGTVDDNNKDRHVKGRTKVPYLPGELGSNAKLSWSQVSEIRQRYTGRHGQLTQLAKEYCISLTTIFSIVNYKTWKDNQNG